MAADLIQAIETLRSVVEEITGYPTYSDYMWEPLDEDGIPIVENLKDSVVYFDDEDPWQFTEKAISMNVRVVFRYVLSRTEGDEFYETHAKEEALEALQNINGSMIGGMTLVFTRSRCFGDAANRYIIDTLYKIYVTE